MNLPCFLMPAMIIVRWLQVNVVVHPTVEWQDISLFSLMLKPITFMIMNSGIFNVLLDPLKIQLYMPVNIYLDRNKMANVALL